MDTQDITQQTLQALEQVFKNGPSGVYNHGSGLIQKDITQATGLVAYNLEAGAKLLQPVRSPLRNLIPRKTGGRGTAAEWKVITSLNSGSDVVTFTADGTKAGTISYTVTPKSAGYRTVSKGDNASFQSQWAGVGFEDVRAKSVSRLLSYVMIMEERNILGADTTLDAPAAPTVTTANDGSIAAGTYNVICRAKTNIGRGRKSAATSTGALSGNDDSISASVPYVAGAVEYEWYVGAAASEKLEATTRINSVKLTSLAGTGTLASAVTDNHVDALAWQGLIRQISDGGVVRRLATGTSGTGTALALSDVDTVLQSMWDTWQSDPEHMWVNSAESIKITKLVLAANGAPGLYVVPDSSAQGALTGGYRVTHYVNPVTGRAVQINTHPYLKAGTMLITSHTMPFPSSDISDVMEMDLRQDYLQLDYPITSPKWEFEVLMDGVLKLYFPGGCGIIQNINGQ